MTQLVVFIDRTPALVAAIGERALNSSRRRSESERPTHRQSAAQANANACA